MVGGELPPTFSAMAKFAITLTFGTPDFRKAPTTRQSNNPFSMAAMANFRRLRAIAVLWDVLR